MAQEPEERDSVRWWGAWPYRRGRAVPSTGGVDVLYYRNNPCGKNKDLSTAMEEKDTEWEIQGNSGFKVEGRQQTDKRGWWKDRRTEERREREKNGRAMGRRKWVSGRSREPCLKASKGHRRHRGSLWKDRSPSRQLRESFSLSKDKSGGGLFHPSRNRQVNT